MKRYNVLSVSLVLIVLGAVGCKRPGPSGRDSKAIEENIRRPDKGYFIVIDLTGSSFFYTTNTAKASTLDQITGTWLEEYWRCARGLVKQMRAQRDVLGIQELQVWFVDSKNWLWRRYTYDQLGSSSFQNPFEQDLVNFLREQNHTLDASQSDLVGLLQQLVNYATIYSGGVWIYIYSDMEQYVPGHQVYLEPPCRRQTNDTLYSSPTLADLFKLYRPLDDFFKKETLQKVHIRVYSRPFHSTCGQNAGTWINLKEAFWEDMFYYVSDRDFNWGGVAP